MGFSTLYRVDAIEGYCLLLGRFLLGGFSTLYRVDAIEGQLAPHHHGGRARFSTLYRVDAIEGKANLIVKAETRKFQYPLSGRCY